MDFKKIAEHFRHSTTPLAVTDIVIISDQCDFTGHGKILQEGGRIALDVTLQSDGELVTPTGICTRDQYWKVGGIIEGQTPFWAVGLPHGHGLQTARFTIRTGRFDFDRVHHLLQPIEDGDFRAAVLANANTEEPPPGPMLGDYALARVADFNLVWADQFTEAVEEHPFLGKTTKTRRDTLCGGFDNVEYGLIQRGPDMEIHVREKSGAPGSRIELSKIMQAMYRALAFLHGRHCWPQWERFCDGRKTVAEYSTAPQNVSENIHTLLTATTASNGAKPTQLIEKVVRAFLRADAFAEGLDNYLFLAREAAGSDTPAHIRTLGLCTVFEGFVGFLYDHLYVAEKDVQDTEFEKARSRLVRFAKDEVAQCSGSSNAGVAWNRLIGLVGGARPLRPADKYERLVQALGLPTEKLQGGVAAWKKYRHPLAHGAAPSVNLVDQFVATSRIAGAINVLAGAAVGYSGLAVLSRIEDEYIQI